MGGIIRAGLVATACLLTSTAWAHQTATSGPMQLTGHDLLRYLHIVLLVFWLGPEVAITIAGSYAANLQLSLAQRAGAARMAEYYAIMPRACMSLMLTVGGILTEFVGLEHPWWQMAGIILLGPVWLVLTLAAYFGGPAALATRLEWWLRVAVVIAVPVSVGYSVITDRLAEAPYVGSKLLLFALVVVLATLAERAYAPFLAAAKQLGAAGASPDLERTIAVGFHSGRRFVVATGAALLLAALIGVVQPGVPDDSTPAADSSQSPR